MIQTCLIRLFSNSLWALLLLLPLALVRFISRDSSIKRLIHNRPQVRNSILILCGIFTACCIPADYTYAYTEVPHEVSVDTIWTKDAGPYEISWQVTIPPERTLAIEPGTVLVFTGGKFVVEGNLRMGDVQTGTTSEDVIIESGTLSLFVDGGYAALQNITSDGAQFIVQQNARLEFKEAKISRLDLMIVDTNSAVDVTNSLFSGGYINIIGQSSVTFASTSLSDMSEMRVFDQSTLSLQNTSCKGFEGFLVKNASKLSIAGSRIEDVLAENTFSIANHSTLSLSNSYVEPLFSDFALVLDSSSLEATSTHITHILQKGIQVIRNGSVSLFDVTMDHVIHTEPFDTFFIESVGSRLSIRNSSFIDVAGNVFELYSSNTIPYSLITMTESRLIDYGNSGIYAVQATGTVQHSLVQGGNNGVEHMFSHLSISDSSFIDNSDCGACAYVPGYPLVATNNFWGDVSGPYHTVSNPLGGGNFVSDSVVFTPWLSSDPLTPCCSSVLFLPGLMASRLYIPTHDGETKVWEPGITTKKYLDQLFLNPEGTSIRTDVYTRDVLDEALLPTIGPNIYKSFIADMDDLKETEVIHDWQVVPYDWRLSLDDILNNSTKTDKGITYTQSTTSSYIFSEVERLASESKTHKVTIVAHSNGGLLAKALLLKLRDQGLEYLVDTLVMVAVPQTGTPQAIGALLHGFGQGIPRSLPFLVSPARMQQWGLNMPGAYGLLPSVSYFDSVTDPVLVFDRTATSASRLITSMVDLFLFLNSSLNTKLLTYTKKLHERIDSWTPPIGMSVVQIAGWGSDTLKGLTYYEGIKKGKPVTYYKPLFTSEGDETVVVPSALALATSTPEIHRYWLDLAKVNKGKLIKRSHADILEVAEVRDSIRSIITKKPYTSAVLFSTSSPRVYGGKKLQFILHFETAQVDMYDSQGNHTGISTTTGDIEEHIPDTSYRLLGDVAYISIPEETVKTNSGPLRITVFQSPQSLIGSDTYTLDVVESQHDAEEASVSFIDVPLEKASVSNLEVPGSLHELGSLRVDKDNDGVDDFEVRPGEIVPYEAPRVVQAVQTQTSQSGGRARHTETKEVFTYVPPLIKTESLPVLEQKNEIATASLPYDIGQKSEPLYQTASVYSAAGVFDVSLWLRKVKDVLLLLFNLWNKLFR